MTYETTARHIGHDQREQEIAFHNPNTGRDRQGLVAEVTHYLNADTYSSDQAHDEFPLTTSIRLCGAEWVDFLPPDTPITVAGDPPDVARMHDIIHGQ